MLHNISFLNGFHGNRIGLVWQCPFTWYLPMQVVELLLKHNASVSRTNNRGHNALSVAIENGHE